MARHDSTASKLIRHRREIKWYFISRSPIARRYEMLPKKNKKTFFLDEVRYSPVLTLQVAISWPKTCITYL